MFNRHSNHEQPLNSVPRRWQGQRRATRRLRVEALEGRLMLATSITALDYTPWNLSGAQYSVAGEVGALADDLGPIVRFNGGFISTNLSGASSNPHVTLLAGPHVTAVAGVGTWDASLLNSTHVFHIIPRGNYGGLTDWIDEDAAWGESIQPAIIIIDTPYILPTIEATFAPPATPQSISETTELGANRSEGGSIPIQPILANIGSSQNLGSVSEIATVRRGRMGSDLFARNRIADTSLMEQGELAGEWARPMMLETAGGEPTTLERPAPSDRSEPQNMPSEILNSAEHDARPSALHSVSSIDGISSGQPKNGGLVQADTTRHPFLASEQVGIAAGEWGSKFPQLVSQEFHNGERREIDALASDISADAFGEAFSQLAQASKANVRQAENESPWRKSLVAVPILLMLAVERIAASSSRRASNGSATPAWRPLRSQQEPVDHRRD